MKTLPVTLLLCLTVMMVLPSTMPRAHAVSSNGNNYWSAYGPRVESLLYKVYADFTSMFTDFQAGGVDITDWPIQAGDLSTFVNNPDFFVSPKVGDFGIFQVDMNHQDPFLTVGWQVARTTNGPGATPGTTGTPLFSTGTPSLTLTNACSMPCLGLALTSDPHIRFVDSPPAAAPNAPGTWAAGKAVVYDVDSDGIFDAPGTASDIVISGSGIATGTNLSVDPKIKYTDDYPTNGIWNPGEAAAYDVNNNNILDSGEAVIAGPSNHFDLAIHLKNIEEGGGLIKDANNLLTVAILGQSTPTATKSDDGNPSPSGTYSGTWGIGLSSIPPAYNVTTTIYSGSAAFSTSGTTQPLCLVGQQCTFDLNVNYNSPSAQKPSVAGVEIARALAHLVDKPSFLTGPALTPPGGTPLADCNDVQAPPSQNLMSSIGAGACNKSSSPDAATIQADCVEHADLFGTSGQIGGTTCSPVSLYNLKADNIAGAASCAPGTVGLSCFPSQSASPPPVGYSGLLDLAAACESFVNAGFTIVGAVGLGLGQQCTNVAQGTGHLNNNAGTVVMYIRTDAPRQAYGTILADSINYLFGTPAPTGGTVNYGVNTSPSYWTIGQISSIVFSVQPVADWNLYTGGFTLSSTPDHLYALYHSQFASSQCGGAQSKFPNNYPLWCDPEFDTQANAGEFVAGATLPGFQQAAILGATRGATVPIYSGENQFAALNAWNWQTAGTGTSSSLVTVKGHGFEASSGFTLNMRPVPGYVPSNSLYYASGCNPSTGCKQNLIRRSMAQTTTHMSPYTATTAWEFEPLIQIYDSMLAVDPNTGGLCQTQPGGTAHCIDWMTNSHSTSFDSTTGLSTQTWNLRNDIYFHDGVAVTAHDVCFSILSYKAAPSANFLASVSNVLSCTAITSRVVQVVLKGQSPFNELNIGGVFILPEHVWALLCGGLTAGTDACVTPANLASTTLDPVAAGDMVGSGPWICNTSVGVSTISGQASCSQNASGSAGGQAVGAGGRVLLNRNTAYMRCCDNVQTPKNGISTTNLQALEWADANKDGKVTIIDIAAAASHFGSYNSYFASPLYGANAFDPTKPNGGLTVDIGDIATIGAYFDDGLTAPFLGTPNGYLSATPPGLNQLDPVIDPYDLPVTLSGVTTLDWAYGLGVATSWGSGTSGTTSVSGLSLLVQSNLAIPAGASYSATIISAPAGSPLNPCTVGGTTFSDGTLGPVTLSFAASTTGPTPLQFNFGHCFSSGTYTLRISYTPPGGSSTTFWTVTVVKP
jgi:ABC-type transport system substrate-binding protein